MTNKMGVPVIGPNMHETRLVNAFTVDVEDYFQVSAFEDKISRDGWERIDTRIERNIDKLMMLLDEFNVKGTFFVLGWVAEHYPNIIKNIAANGHEIASHGYWHRRATQQTKGEFKKDVLAARNILQDLTGESIEGYRAPSFSIDKSNEWAYDILSEIGHTYSSSIYPVVHDHYGMPDAPRFMYQTKQGIWEVPLSTLVVAGKNFPISGGGYFRLYPYTLSAWAIRKMQARDRQPYNFYMHPWEVDPDQPRQEGLPLKTKFRHYVNLHRVEPRLRKMLAEFRWGHLGELVNSGTIELR